ncbi:ABC transporter permease [Paenibacillus polymyxa]|uniref:ABC transporter permease n=1 Tax=Paenibacillus TaxID=44249 RepID=UPI0002D53EEE|nr:MULTISPECIES: ABC transporter permease [Paenibacillus]AHM64282.1 ABC transporter [Paenibacillus polymyxa SQR-21]AIY09957.1 potassium ABC transporter permease [Paenibacillus polymyxa]AUS24830.1 potassium ABC transporter permease [Paenibacillus polymyxa]KAF6653915.1 ABC transporter permease [Paenibacillus sp. EKM301P]NMP08221.1 ABC transporter permease [Paenibacillus polymyxa]
MNRLGTVIGFTFRQKARTKSFIITTLVLALLITLGMNLPYLISLFKGEGAGGSGTTAAAHQRLGLIAGNQTEVANQLERFTKEQSNPAAIWVRYDSVQAPTMQQALNNGKLQGYVQFTEPAAKGDTFPKVEYVSVEKEPSPAVITLVQTGLQEAKVKAIMGDKSLTSDQIREISTPVLVDSREVDSPSEAGGAAGKEEKATSMINYGLVYVLMILFFTSSMMTGNMIAAEVTSEKSSRIMEILITSVSPLTQMFGKIIGIFLVGLLQIAVFAAVMCANLMLPHNNVILSSVGLDLSQLNIAVLGYGLIFYILGYFLYAVLFAAVGSIVSRTEELGQAIMPITVLSLAAFYIGIFNIAAPDTIFIKVAGYIPFFSPTVMLLRIGLERASLLEIWLSLAILVASILLFGWLAAKIYRTGVLMYGKRPSFKELRKAMKAYKI